MQIGKPFNPYQMFTGIFIPEGLVGTKGLSHGAKLVYGRLARYAGKDGKCYPRVPTLAAQVGKSKRQVQYYLSELERKKFRRPEERGDLNQEIHLALWRSLEGDSRLTEP